MKKDKLVSRNKIWGGRGRDEFVNYGCNLVFTYLRFGKI